jgi:SAM-dependent methyltransferase
MTTPPERIVNSRAYWDARFASGSWEQQRGYEQTAYFASELLAQIPEGVHEELQGMTRPLLVDWGCAHGEGVLALSNAFPRAMVWGYDFSTSAVARAAAHVVNRANVAFTAQEELLPAAFDLVVCSNVLEHFRDWRERLQHLCAISRRYVAVLVPYRDPVGGEHVVSFHRGAFPPRVGDHVKIADRPFDCDAPGLWVGEQEIVVYAIGGEDV